MWVIGVALIAAGGGKAYTDTKLLSDSERTYLALFEDNLAVKLIVEAGKGRVWKVNRAAEAFYGYPEGRLCEMWLSDIEPPDNGATGTVRRHRLASGETCFVEVFESPVTIGGKPYRFLIVQDVSKRVKAEEEIRKLSAVVEQSPVTVVITDVEGNIEYANPKFTKLTGYTLDEVMGKNPRKLKSGYHDPVFYEELRGTVAEGGVWHGEFKNVKKDGEQYWERAVISPIKDAGGKITHYLAVKEDITAQKIIDEALRNTAEGVAGKTGEQFFEALVSYLAHALDVKYAVAGVIDPQNEKTISSICFYSGGEFAENFSYAYTGTPCEMVVREGYYCFPSGVRQTYPDYEMLYGLGAESYAGILLRNSSGDAIGMLAVLDVEPLKDTDTVHKILQLFATRAAAELERVNSARALEQSDKQFRQIAGNLDEVLWLSSPDRGEMRYVSPAYEKIWGRSRESLYADPDSWWEAVPAEDRQELTCACEEDGAAGSMENGYRIIRPDGLIRWIREKAFPIKDESGHVSALAGVARDVTMIHELDRQKEDFSAMVRHDMKTPLAVIKGNADLLLEDYGPALGEDACGMLAAINTNANYIAHMLEDLALIFRLETSAMPLNLDVEDVSMLLLEVKANTADLARKKGIEYTLEDGGELPDIPLDRWHIQRALSNLVDNAVKFTPEGGSVALGARLGDEDGARYVELYVSDSGPGIAASERERVFYRNYRSPRAKGVSGTGLGLAIVKAVAEAHHGRVELSSEEGAGSTFRIIIPIA